MSNKCEFLGFSLDVEILPSALRHGLTEEDILQALKQSIYDETLVVDPNKTLAIGFDKAARLLEIIFHITEEDCIVVFHAMLCRKTYIDRVF